jgi:ubiquinone/menaquinone biosynthesis C-methylase UbiE
MPVRVQKALLREENVVREEARYYDLYKSVAATGSADGTKWAHETEALLAQLARHDVRVAGQEVLDISGGPGFLARDLSSTVKRVVVTEYSDESVEGMRAALGLDVRKYDFNNDELHARVDGTFDVVLIRYSINFCQNLGAFGRELRRVMRPGGFVWVSFVLPTLGCCLRWMHDEYTYHALYSPETLHAAFAEADFTLVARETEPRYRYTAGRGFGVNALSVPYLLSATLRPTGSYNRELIQKNLALLFRADGAG